MAESPRGRAISVAGAVLGSGCDSLVGDPVLPDVPVYDSVSNAPEMSGQSSLVSAARARGAACTLRPRAAGAFDGLCGVW